jgi:ferredoxin-thioredoxin reductase catalytic subunit
MRAVLMLAIGLFDVCLAYTRAPTTAHLSFPSSKLGRGKITAARMAARTFSEDDPEYEEQSAKALKAMVGFANSYCKNTDTTYCSDPSIPAVRSPSSSPLQCATFGPTLECPSAVCPQYVLKGLAEHKVTLGAPLCPCRHYEDKEAEAKDGYWNCPCVPMRERHECHCM